MKKPAYTFKDGSKISYTGKRDVTAIWSFENKTGNVFGGFSLNEKAALSTAAKNFKLYTDGGHELVTGSIKVFAI